MIQPSLEDLLDGVAAGLEDNLLPVLSGPLRRQTRESIRILRRVARILDKVGPALHEDNSDMEDTLRALLGAVSDPALRDRILDGLGTDGEAPAAPASLARLRRRNRDLQALLLDADAFAHALPAPDRDAALTRLRAFYRRSLQREAALC